MAQSDFERAAAEGEQNPLAEFWSFLMNNKKWWLLPVLLSLLALAALAFLSGGAAAPFIYTLF